MNELEKVIEQMLDKLNKMETGQKEMKADHGEILTALRHSSETHTAKLDNLEV